MMSSPLRLQKKPEGHIDAGSLFFLPSVLVRITRAIPVN